MSIMEKPKRKRYDETFKRACVESLVNSGKPLKEVAGRSAGCISRNFIGLKEEA